MTNSVDYYMSRLYGLAEVTFHKLFNDRPESDCDDYVVAHLDEEEYEDDTWEMRICDYTFLQEVKHEILRLKKLEDTIRLDANHS